MTIVLIVVLFLLILNPDISSISVMNTCNIWLKSLVPVLFPAMIILDILSKSKIIEYSCYYLFPIFRFIFNIRYPKSVLLIILSILGGAPTSTKLIKEAYINKEIDLQEANSLIYSFSFLSISYMIYILNLYSINISYLLLLLLSSIIIMKILNRGDFTSNKSYKNNDNILNTFYLSIGKTTDILLGILGIMICFNILLTIFLPNQLFYPIFEVLTGHQILLSYEINKRLKDFLLAFSLINLGFSLHLQILYIFDEFKYLKFFTIKLSQALFVSCFLLI